MKRLVEGQDRSQLILLLIDIACRRQRFNRLEIRRRNLVSPAAMPYRNPLGLVYDSGDYPASLQRAAEVGDWAGFAARRAEARRRGRCRGIGIAASIELNTGAPRERAEITIDPSGVVELVLGTMSAGQGHETSFAQVIGEWLGVEPDRVRLVTGDTDRVQVGGGSASARSMRLGSWVIAKAADAIVEKGRRIAGALLEAAEEDIEFAQGRFVVKGTDRSVGLFEVAAAVRGDGVAPDLRGRLGAVADETMPIPSYAYTSAVCEVEVDPETGLVEIVRYASIDDCGRAVNPMLIHGQSHGGIAQGIGQALWEGCVYDPHSGQLLSGSLMDYAMPRADLLPAFDTEVSEVPSTTNPLGMRGGSEGGITPGWRPSRMRSSMRSPSSASSISSFRPRPSASGTRSAPRVAEGAGSGSAGAGDPVRMHLSVAVEHGDVMMGLLGGDAESRPPGASEFFRLRRLSRP